MTKKMYVINNHARLVLKLVLLCCFRSHFIIYYLLCIRDDMFIMHK